MCEYHKNSFGIIRTDFKNRIFLIPVAYWLGFGIFKQNRENSDEIGMVRQSAIMSTLASKTETYIPPKGIAYTYMMQ